MPDCEAFVVSFPNRGNTSVCYKLYFIYHTGCINLSKFWISSFLYVAPKVAILRPKLGSFKNIWEDPVCSFPKHVMHYKTRNRENAQPREKKKVSGRNKAT